MKNLKHTMIYTAEEVAVILRQSPATIKKRLESGEIPAYREGSHWKIPVNMLERYVEARALTETKERRRIHDDVE